MMRIWSLAAPTRVVLVLCVAAAAVPAALSQEGSDARQGARVFTNADLPTELSVSVIGGPAEAGETSRAFDMDEIERIAAMNERARREYEERRPQGQPEILVVEERSYPWIVSNVGCVGFSRCVSLPRRPRNPSVPHLRNALPDPPEGFVLRPGPHLAPDSSRRPPTRRGPRGHEVPPSSRGHVTPRSPR